MTQSPNTNQPWYRAGDPFPKGTPTVLYLGLVFV